MPSISGGESGQRYWRSLDELADAPEFRAFLESEFPHLAPALVTSPSRRQFLKVMGASLALGGMLGCRWPEETIVPFANRPAGRAPGEPVSYATAMELGGVGTGLLVTSYDGRPVKIEGNELHPDSLGATDALAQASILELYDPDRSTQPVARTGSRRENRGIQQFDEFARAHFDRLRASGGDGLLVLAEPSASPSRTLLRARFQQVFPNAAWVESAVASRDNEREGSRLAFGSPYRAHYHFDAADVIVSLDDDFLMRPPTGVHYTREFARRRSPEHGAMNRLYVAESNLTITGSNADHRYAVRSVDVPVIAGKLVAALLEQGLRLPHALADLAAEIAAYDRLALAAPYLTNIARDLLASAGRGVILVGPRQPAIVHALGHALNATLGNVGHAVTYTADVVASQPSLAEALAPGRVQTLLILDGNPAYTAPADLGFADRLDQIETSIHLSVYDDETSQHCLWHVPRAHYLESWDDTRAVDGTVSIVQPLIAPLYGCKTPIEMLALMLGDEPAHGYDIVRRTFREQLAGPGDFENQWRRALHDGVVAGSSLPSQTPTLLQPAAEPAPPSRATRLRDLATRWRPADTAFELVFAPDNTLHDGRFANNGWLQELPDPITKLTWDNAALMSPADATRLGVKRGDKIEIALNGRSLTIPVCPVPGHAPGSITLPLGYGRTHGGRVAAGSGFDAYRLRTTETLHVAAGATVKVVDSSYTLATTQDHHAVATEVGEQETQKRAPELVREATLAEYKEHPDFVKHRAHSLPLVQPFGDHEFPDKPRWAMAIDLAKCTGCSACVVACQAENNVPVVGKDEVLMGREMHWIRLDRYFKGDPEDADAIQVAHQPVACQHCENAPCEQVCPVAATVHDEEGLNVMVYNRCIGTRYCSNNCPYKVRRFNWFWNHHGPAHPRSDGKLKQMDLTEIEKMVFNPDVTVRSRGVMEKCTFCTQRINAVKINAKNEGRPIADGEIVPACAQVCPAEAIVFGDLNDKNSAVRKAHEHNRAYALLEFLNVRPRNVYLANLRNPSDADSATGHNQDTHHTTTEHTG